MVNPSTGGRQFRAAAHAGARPASIPAWLRPAEAYSAPPPASDHIRPSLVGKGISTGSPVGGKPLPVTRYLSALDHSLSLRPCDDRHDSVVVQADGESRMMTGLRTGFFRTAVLALLFVVCAGPSLRAQERPEFRVSRVASPPKIDGVLDDPAWNGDPLLLGPWISYNLCGARRAPSGPRSVRSTTIGDDKND